MSFLDEFLDQSKQNNKVDQKMSEQDKATVPNHEPDLTEEERQALQSKIIDTLCEIYDPEIPVSIYEMGLIYDIIIDVKANVKVLMTLTSPNCPVAETMPGEVEYKTGIIDGVRTVEVELVWSPPWDMSMMSEAARLEMGFM